jgi:DNA-binding NarL/FixJ family response regulator
MVSSQTIICRFFIHQVVESERTMSERPRVLLADDQPVMLEGLKMLLESRFEVVGAVTDGRVLLEVAAKRRPDLVIADISMTGLDGIEATRRLRTILPDARVVILTSHTEPSWVRAAFDAGACGYLTKRSVAEEIQRALREVLRGHCYVSPMVARAAVDRDRGPSPVGRPRRPGGHEPPAGQALTPRQRDVVRLVGQGLGNKDIAHRLGVAVTTVRTHLKSVYDKLGLAGRVGLALHAAPRFEPAPPPIDSGTLRFGSPP